MPLSSAMPVPMLLASATLPGPVGVHQARHAEHAVGAERQRVEEVVVDAAVDHVHALQAARRPHEDAVLIDDQVAALDQLDAHPLGEEAVLEVGRVVHARAEQHDGRVGPAGRGDVLAARRAGRPGSRRSTRTS